jgi:hypothetical protein
VIQVPEDPERVRLVPIIGTARSTTDQDYCCVTERGWTESSSKA